jgi:hypothetical protein
MQVGKAIAMRPDTNDLSERRLGGDKRPSGAQPIDKVLQELIAQYSARFPQLKIVLISRAGETTVGSP